MTCSPSKQIPPATPTSEDREYTAEIVAHPNRLRGLLAEKRACEDRLAKEKNTAIAKVKEAIAEAEAIHTGNDIGEVGWVIAELNLIMKEILPIQPTDLPHPDSLNTLVHRLHRALVALMYYNSTALLKRTCQSLISADPR